MRKQPAWPAVRCRLAGKGSYEVDELARVAQRRSVAEQDELGFEQRESDRVLILGDVLNNMDVITGLPGLKDPKPYFTTDPALNRRSAKRLALLEPKLVLFGHGAPLRDTRKFVDFANALPE